MSTHPSFDASTKRDIKAWERMTGLKRKHGLKLKTVEKRDQHHHFFLFMRLSIRNLDISNVLLVLGCQSCTCVWPTYSWLASSLTYWWCSLHPLLDKWRICPWKAEEKTYTHIHLNHHKNTVKFVWLIGDPAVIGLQVLKALVQPWEYIYVFHITRFRVIWDFAKVCMLFTEAIKSSKSTSTLSDNIWIGSVGNTGGWILHFISEYSNCCLMVS